MRKIVLALALSLSAAVVYAAGFRVELPPQPTAPEQFAAAELAKYLAAAAPHGLTLGGQTEVTFHVGNTEFARNNGIDATQLTGDSFRLRTLEGDVILAGGGSRGTLYAVSRFLEQFAGVRFYTPDVELVPEHGDGLALPEFDLTVTPAFTLREIFPTNWAATNDHGLWAVRNRLNGWGSRGIDREFGGALHFGSPDSSHTFDCYFPEVGYLEAHPEFFSLLDGKRRGGQFTGQLCLTNPEMTRQFIAKLKQFIVDDEAAAAAAGTPPPRLYDVSQNDNSFVCQCPDCQKIVVEEGAPSGLVLHFVNQVAQAVKEFRSDIYVTTLAYGITEKPPKHIRALDNVIVRLTNTSSNKVASILAPEQTPHRSRVEEWHNKGGIYIWEYPTNYSIEVPPYPNEFFLPDLVKFYHDHGVNMLFFEFSAPPRDDMPELKQFLTAKLLENPDADWQGWMDDFLQGYYGAAAPEIRRYREILFDSVQRRPSYVYRTVESYNFLDYPTVTAAYAALDRAAAAVAEQPGLLERVQRARYNLDMAAFMRFRLMMTEFLRSGGKQADFPLHQEQLLSDILREWHRINATAIRPELRESQETLMREFEQRYAGHPDVTPQPTLPQFTSEALDITVDLGKTHSLELRQDPDSPVGFAVFVDWAQYGKSGAVPLVFGAYNDIKAERIGVPGVIDPDTIPGPGYNYYYCMTVKPEFSSCIYFLDGWDIQFAFDSAATLFPDRECDVYISAKFTGAPYKYSNADAPYGLWIDRCIIVPR